jgi:hypothetical protein
MIDHEHIKHFGSKARISTSSGSNEIHHTVFNYSNTNRRKRSSSANNDKLVQENVDIQTLTAHHTCTNAISFRLR